MKRIRIAVVGLNFGAWMIEHELLSSSAHGERAEDPAYADHIVSGIHVIEMMRRQGEKSC